MPLIRADLFLTISKTGMCLLTLSFFKRFTSLVPSWPRFEKKLVLLLFFKVSQKGEFQICPRMDLDNILYVEYLRYNNYKNEIILFLERC